MVTALISATLFYALVKRRIGPLPALAPTLVLLFLGAAWHHVAVPIGFTIILSVAAGLAALLALERADRRGDVAACLLIALSIFTFTIGLAFLVGVAISVLIRGDRRRRAWIFLIPFALYSAWWLWSLGAAFSSPGQTTPSNVLLIPNYVAESLAAVTAALAGLSHDFDQGPFIEPGWGRILAVAAVVALVLRIRRGNVPPTLWVALGVVLAYWALGALAANSSARGPWAIRYMYPGAVGVLLTTTATASGIRFSRLGLGALFAATAVSLATNLALLRDGAALFRDYSSRTRAQLAMLELARDRVDPYFDADEVGANIPPNSPDAGAYLAGVDRYGSPAFPLAEVARQSDSVRQAADQVLASALELQLVPSHSGARSGEACRHIRSSEAGEPITFEVPTGGARMRVRAAAPASVAVGRFATSQSAELGDLSPGEQATLRIPPDSSPTPWRASATDARSVTVCAL
jgi:hypothetical protein